MATPTKDKAKAPEEEATEPDVTSEEGAGAEAPAKKEKVKKEPPPPVQRSVKASMADDKITRVIDLLKKADHPLTYQEIMEEADVLYDVCQFSLTALALVGIVEKVGTWQGQSRSRIAWTWVGEK